MKNRLIPLVLLVLIMACISDSMATPTELTPQPADKRAIQTNSSDPEIHFIGLPGALIRRWTGCESDRLGDLRVDCSPQYSADERTFPAETIAEAKHRAHEMGGDLVSFFRAGSNSIECVVHRRRDPDCQPILIFYAGAGPAETAHCPMEPIGPLLETRWDGMEMMAIIDGAFADSVRVRGGEALRVTPSDSLLIGEVLRLMDPTCSEWIIE